MFFFYSKHWLILISKYCVALSLLTLTSACNANTQAQSENSPTLTQNQIKQTTQVVALGKLIPQGEVIKLSVANAEDSRVNQIFVKEGDLVEKNQVIAILQGIDRRERDLEAAEKAVELAQAKLEQTRAGETKQADLAAQIANISRLESMLQNETIEKKAAIASAEAQLKQAQLTYERNQTLRLQGGVSQQTLDQAQEQLNVAQAILNERKAQLSNTEQTLKAEIAQERENLAKLREIRPVDVKVAQVELEKAKIAVKQRKADLEDMKVKVPVAGQILRINTRVGERVNIQQGIVELGQTQQMYVVAEIHETDIAKVRIGQKATISSEYGGFEGDITGKVEHLGLQVGAKQLSRAAANPTQDENSRIVEVKIRIDPEDSIKVANFTYMKVRVEIQ